jgi:hypothetical protein
MYIITGMKCCHTQLSVPVLALNSCKIPSLSYSRCISERADLVMILQDDISFVMQDRS